MKNLIVIAILMFSGAACSAPNRLELPPPPGPPGDWNQFSKSTMPGSGCPKIEGLYLEPPSIQRSGHDAKFLPEDTTWLFIGYVPLHLADRKELAASELNIRKSSFAIRQPHASHFYLSFLNDGATAISEYYFRSDEGDFECRDGYIEFPRISRYGMIEGRSVNFQIRNILLKDMKGALIIQSTRGPNRGSSSTMDKDVMYEFFRYPLAN
jgi:hypothetical protein